jgi:hypothetical protein
MDFWGQKSETVNDQAMRYAQVTESIVNVMKNKSKQFSDSKCGSAFPQTYFATPASAWQRCANKILAICHLSSTATFYSDIRAGHLVDNYPQTMINNAKP